MIFLRISGKDEQQIETIAETLLKDRLAIDINIKRNIERLELQNGEINKCRIFLLTAKTKGLLFREIDRRLLKTYPDNMPEIYSLPIVDMDWEQAEHLGDDLMPV